VLTLSQAQWRPNSQIQSEATKEAVIGSGGLYAPDANILQAEDIASAILYVVSQPEHVNGELLIRPRIQEL